MVKRAPSGGVDTSAGQVGVMQNGMVSRQAVGDCARTSASDGKDLTSILWKMNKLCILNLRLKHSTAQDNNSMSQPMTACRFFSIFFCLFSFLFF